MAQLDFYLSICVISTILDFPVAAVLFSYSVAMNETEVVTDT